MEDLLVTVGPLLEMVGDWQQFLSDADEEDANKIRGHERTGRALGGDSFLDLLGNVLERAVKPKKAARKRKIDK
jgi:putative transposase